MLPLLQPGDEILVDPAAYRRHPPRPGDIVVARHPYRTDLILTKRIAAISPDGHYQLTGDNPAESTDSRAWGAVQKDKIIGRVVCRF